MDLTGRPDQGDPQRAVERQQRGHGQRNKILQVSGLTYTWDKSDAALVNGNAIVGT